MLSSLLHDAQLTQLRFKHFCPLLFHDFLLTISVIAVVIRFEAFFNYRF